MIEELRFRPKTTLDNCILSLCYSSYVVVFLVWPHLAALISQVPLCHHPPQAKGSHDLSPEPWPGPALLSMA